MSFITPTRYSIPSGYDYKNINLNNFGGINLSENPFEGSNSECFDAENLYVNEESILAVRPRLEPNDNVGDGYEILNFHNISPYEAIYVLEVKNSEEKLLRYKNRSTSIEIDINITDSPLGKHSFVKLSAEDVLCTSENGLYKLNIKDKTFSSVTPEDGYVPTTKINMTLGDPYSGESTIEPENILSNKYKQEYAFPWFDSKNQDFTGLKDHVVDAIDGEETSTNISTIKLLSEQITDEKGIVDQDTKVTVPASASNLARLYMD